MLEYTLDIDFVFVIVKGIALFFNYVYTANFGLFRNQWRTWIQKKSWTLRQILDFMLSLEVQKWFSTAPL